MFENRNEQVCWKFPHAQKEEHFFPLVGTLYVLQSLTDEAGLLLLGHLAA